MSLAQKPLRRLCPPRYPTRLEIETDRSLLRENLPPGWRASKKIVRAVTLSVAVSASGCAGSNARPAADSQQIASRENGASGSKSTVDPCARPISVSGGGRGAIGCMAINPPFFLSEEEAMEVISSELGRNGVHLTEHETVLEDVLIPRRVERYFKNDAGEMSREVVDVPGEGMPLSVDAVDRERNIGIEFVSGREYNELGGVASNSSIQDYDFKALASEVETAVRSTQKDLVFKAFYDPIMRPKDDACYDKLKANVDDEDENERLWSAAYDRYHAILAADAQEVLRAQVVEFVEWLKGQGII